ncbi:hypothetical protein [Amphibacillus jilinensis]|uniref:hypothetical protein n=1 Tax=Amphibacillus jilinensis TaxID=1216008 RepID=UPI00036B3095|nr:hypothetical protein [Amphibacillus jilinensis]
MNKTTKDNRLSAKIPPEEGEKKEGYCVKNNLSLFKGLFIRIIAILKLVILIFIKILVSSRFKKEIEKTVNP